MLFNNKLFNSIACLLSFTNLQLVIPGRTWILLYLGRTVYKRLWACLALYPELQMQQIVASGLAAHTCQFDRPCTNLAWCSFPGESHSQRIHLNSPPQEFTRQQPKK